MRRSSEETKRRILEAAMRVFARHGFHRAPVAEIAKEARVSKALVFWHYGSKEKLVEEVLRIALPMDVVERCLAERLEGVELLRCIASQYLEKYSDPVMRLLLLHALAARGSLEHVDRAFDMLCGPMLDEVAERALGTRGREARIKARMFFGSLLCYALNPPRDIEPREYVETLVKLLSAWEERPRGEGIARNTGR